MRHRLSERHALEFVSNRVRFTSDLDNPACTKRSTASSAFFSGGPLATVFSPKFASGNPAREMAPGLGIATKEESNEMKAKALKVNELLTGLFAGGDVVLIDFKLEFGKDAEGNILLADEISPDTCRLWDAKTNQKLDKDLFRRDLGNLTDAYEIILAKLGGSQNV